MLAPIRLEHLSRIHPGGRFNAFMPNSFPCFGTDRIAREAQRLGRSPKPTRVVRTPSPPSSRPEDPSNRSPCRRLFRSSTMYSIYSMDSMGSMGSNGIHSKSTTPISRKTSGLLLTTPPKSPRTIPHPAGMVWTIRGSASRFSPTPISADGEASCIKGSTDPSLGSPTPRCLSQARIEISRSGGQPPLAVRTRYRGLTTEVTK